MDDQAAAELAFGVAPKTAAISLTSVAGDSGLATAPFMPAAR